MVCRLTQHNWMFSAQRWVMPTREQCVAEFGAESGPRLFAGGYHAIEGERTRRKQLASKPKPAAKPVPAVDPRVTELKRMEARVAEMKRCVPMAEELRELQAERDALKTQLAAKATSRKGFASKLRFAQPFRVGRKPA